MWQVKRDFPIVGKTGKMIPTNTRCLYFYFFIAGWWWIWWQYGWMDGWLVGYLCGYYSFNSLLLFNIIFICGCTVTSVTLVCSYIHPQFLFFIIRKNPHNINTTFNKKYANQRAFKMNFNTLSLNGDFFLGMYTPHNIYNAVSV